MSTYKISIKARAKLIYDHEEDCGYIKARFTLSCVQSALANDRSIVLCLLSITISVVRMKTVFSYSRRPGTHLTRIQSTACIRQFCDDYTNQSSVGLGITNVNFQAVVAVDSSEV